MGRSCACDLLCRYARGGPSRIPARRASSPRRNVKVHSRPDARHHHAAYPHRSDPMTKSATVEPLLPVELGAGKIKFAQGVKAGRWVFATGLMAQDFINGIAPDVLAERAPHAGLPKREKEALRIFENLDAVLRAAGTDRSNLVRTDQYYTTVKAVPPYQQVRRRIPARPYPALDVDRAAGAAAAGRRHEHPGHGRRPRHRISRSSTSSTSSSRGVRPPATRPRSRSAISSSFRASRRSRSATSRGATGSPRRR